MNTTLLNSQFANIEILRPVLSDIEDIEQLYATVIRDTFITQNISEQHPDEIKDEVKSKIIGLKADLESNGEEEFHLIAKIDGRIVGIIGFGKVNDEIQKNYPKANSPEEIEVKDVYVLPNAQGKGIGSTLFNQAVQELKRRNISMFFLDSGFKLAQSYWRKKLGDPSIVKENYFGEGEHYMIWKCKVSELFSK